MASAAVHGRMPPKGTEKLVTEVPGGGARLTFCHEHVTSFQSKEKKNHKKVLNSKVGGVGGDCQHTGRYYLTPVVTGQDAFGEEQRAWYG